MFGWTMRQWARVIAVMDWEPQNLEDAADLQCKWRQKWMHEPPTDVVVVTDERVPLNYEAATHLLKMVPM